MSARFGRPAASLATVRRFLAFALGLLTVVPALGQGRVAVTEHPVFTCRLPVTDVSGARDPGAMAPFAPRSGPATAQIEVTYDGFSAQARASFQAAVDVWERYVVSDVPIRIDAHWTPLGQNILGSAGPFLLANAQGTPSGTPIADTWYPFALADALAGRDLQPGGPDIEANFNSAFSDWHFGTGEAPPPGTIDLYTVVVHELGHGLGFIGSASVTGGTGSFGLTSGSSTFPFVYDRFAEDCTDRALLNTAVYPDDSAALAGVLQSEAFFEGPTVVATNGESAPLHTPPSWNAGSSFSHYEEGSYPPGSPGALMTPIIGRGELISAPDALLCAALQDLGWTLAPACAALIPATPPEVEPRVCAEPSPPPLPGGYSLIPVCAAPGCEAADTIVTTSGRAVFELTVALDQAVDVLVFDTRGRRVRAVTLDVREGAPEPIAVNLGDAAAGLYLVRVAGESFAATRKIVRVR